MFDDPGSASPRPNGHALAHPVESQLSSARLKLPRRRAVFATGESADRFFEVETGAVMVYRVLDDGRRQVVEVAFPGDICGLAPGDRQDSCCETLVPTTLCSFATTELERHDALRRRVISRLQKQMTIVHDHIVSLGRRSAQERVCSLILRVFEASPFKTPTTNVVHLPMSRTIIADYLGLTLETVCRTLTDLTRQHLIEPGRGKSEFRIPNLEALRAAASQND